MNSYVITHQTLFVVEDRVVYDNAKVKFINYDDFVFDKSGVDNWDTCSKIYRTYQSFDEIKSNKANNKLNVEKLEMLKGVMAKRKGKEENKFASPKIEVLEYWAILSFKAVKFLK